MQDRMLRFARNDGRIELIPLPWKKGSRIEAIPDKYLYKTEQTQL
jgi:hypothetical protein